MVRKLEGGNRLCPARAIEATCAGTWKTENYSVTLASQEFQTKCCRVSWPLLSIYHETPEEQDELKKELCGSEGELRGPKIC